jgi:hypothetical protein
MNISCSVLFNKVMAAYFENHTKPINILSRQIAGLLIVKAGGTYNDIGL